MATVRETLREWLKDAHAMEHQAIEILEKQAQRTERYPDLQQRIERHLEESRQQAKDIKACIEKMNGDPSSIKKSVAKFMGDAATLANATAEDEVIKNSLADYAFEHFEIASYKALVAAADELGEDEIKRTCQKILRQEEDMADWLDEHLPKLTQEYLERELLT